VIVAEPVEAEVEVEQPTEAIDVTAIWAAEDEAEANAEPETDEERLPDGLDDLEPPPEFR
jgi:hypothetical protein